MKSHAAHEIKKIFVCRGNGGRNKTEEVKEENIPSNLNKNVSLADTFNKQTIYF